MNPRFLMSLIALTLIGVCFSHTVSAQFPLKLPKIPKAEKPKAAPPAEDSQSTDSTASTPAATSVTRSSSGNGRVYENEVRPSTPVVINPLVFVQPAISRTYWKMPNARDTTSWVPELRMQFAYDDSAPIKANVEWYNPDGSLWYTEKLASHGGGDTGLTLRSDETWTVIDTKSTNGVGTYSFKVKNAATGAVMYAGKFKVNKFLNSFNTAEKNKLGFYVDHDWLMPLGVVGFDSQELTKTMNRVVFSNWLKGDIKYEELEAALLYNGKEIARRKASSGMAYDERGTNVLVPLKMDEISRRWTFWFDNVQFLNGNSYNPEYYPNMHFIEKNPGQYTYKLFRNGTQIREFSFSIGPDGRFVRPAYSDNFRFLTHAILVPAKVMGNQEKWNPASAKTDIFFANPISGFSPQ
jgi:hypothetical protein